MVKRIFHTVKGEFVYFFLNSKMIIFVFAVIFLCETLFSSITRLCNLSGMKLSFFEPYLLASSVEIYAIVIPLAFLVLISGFPSRAGYNYFSMIRISRKQWLVGEVSFVVLSSIAYMLLFMVGVLFHMRKYIVWDNSWSSYMLDFRSQFPEEYMNDAVYFLKTNTMTHGSPIMIFIHSVLLMVGMLVVVALIQMCFALLGKRQIGMMIGLGITLLSGVIQYSDGWVKWLFPMSHTNIAIHFDGFRAVAHCEIWMSYVYFGVLIAVLVLVNWILTKKRNWGD